MFKKKSMIVIVLFMIGCSSGNNNVTSENFLPDPGFTKLYFNISSSNDFNPVPFGFDFIGEELITFLYKDIHPTLDGQITNQSHISRMDNDGKGVASYYYENELFRAYFMSGSDTVVVLGDYNEGAAVQNTEELYYSYLKSLNIKEAGFEYWEYRWSFEHASMESTLTSAVFTRDAYFITGKKDNEIYLIKLNLSGEEVKRNVIWENSGDEIYDSQNVTVSKEVEGEGILIAGSMFDFNRENPISSVYCIKVNYNCEVLQRQPVDIELNNPCTAKVMEMELQQNGMVYLLVETTVSGVSGLEKFFKVVLIDSLMNRVGCIDLSEEDLCFKGTVLGSDGSLFLAGYYNKNLAVVLKMDSNLNIVWKKTFSIDQYTEAHDIYELDNGNLMIYGSFYNDEMINYRGDTSRDGFIRTLNSTGNLIN